MKFQNLKYCNLSPTGFDYIKLGESIDKTPIKHISENNLKTVQYDNYTGYIIDDCIKIWVNKSSLKIEIISILKGFEGTFDNFIKLGDNTELIYKKYTPHMTDDDEILINSPFYSILFTLDEDISLMQNQNQINKTHIIQISISINEK
ncbi:MAG: hypothetical protein CL843_14045 [Crocinitomicaceae bacterium]|nr:hypothetical protein [Crocinitomicaceae bacterium]|tara:strand:- start:70 stop:513 length:444 start_codon:yes stop_codon:yes gene_type:complete